MRPEELQAGERRAWCASLLSSAEILPREEREKIYAQNRKMTLVCISAHLSHLNPSFSLVLPFGISWLGLQKMLGPGRGRHPFPFKNASRETGKGSGERFYAFIYVSTSPDYTSQHCNKCPEGRKVSQAEINLGMSGLK